MESKLLNTDEVCKALKISRSTLFRLLKCKVITCYKVGGKLKFSKHDIEQYLASNIRESEEDSLLNF